MNRISKRLLAALAVGALMATSNATFANETRRYDVVVYGETPGGVITL